MFFFNLDTLEEGTECNSEYLVIALQKFWLGIRYPKNAREKHKPLKHLAAGSSWLINPAALFNDKSTDIAYKAQYIRLAGRRNFAMYKTHGITYLDLTLYPDIDMTVIAHNPLLTITNKQIHFKYER